MDVHSWRKILLQWITECNLMEDKHFSIEQTNVDSFFRNFSLKHAVAQKSDGLNSFLREHYPEFQAHVDDRNTLNDGDYIYVYSLLLHFCCIKCPEEYFHSVCKKLSVQAQQRIAEFFNLLLHCPSIDRDVLHQAIVQVVSSYMSSPPNQQHTTESASSSASSSGAISVDMQTSYTSSPVRAIGDVSMRTPNRKILPVVRVSPNTPKSFLLQERTRELYSYKAQLETERYEKGLLEVQLAQNEDQIKSLNTIQKKLQQQIQSLKEEMVNQSIEPKRSEEEDEQLHRRLRRQIIEGEDKIFHLNEKIRNLTEEKTLLENKMKHAEKKAMDGREIITELELKLNEVVEELEKKKSIIKCLTDDKTELEHFIAESRSASGNSRPDINCSSDCLDSSFARYTNSSSSLGSPENLGISVVDVQLREKEHENLQLRDELNEINTSSKKLYNYIQEKVDLYKQEYNFDIINAAPDQDNKDPAMGFELYLQCMNHLNNSYKKAKDTIKKLEGDMDVLQANNSDLNTRLQDSTNEVENVKERLHNLEKRNEMLQKEIANLETLKKELARNYEATVNDFQAQLEKSSQAEEKLKMYIEELSEKNRLQMWKIESLDQIDEKRRQEKEDIQEQLRQTQSMNQALQETIELQNLKLQSQVEAERVVNNKYELLMIQHEEALQKSRETDAHLKTMSKNIKTKEEELSMLGKNIAQLGNTKAELEEHIIELTESYEAEKSKRDLVTQKLQNVLSDTEKVLKKKDHDLKNINSEMDAICKEIQSLRKMLLNVADITVKDGVVIQLNQIQDAVRLLLENEKKNLQKIFEMEKDYKQTLNKLREQVEDKDKLLHQNVVEIDKINERLSKAQAKISQLVTLTEKMHEKHQQEIEKERKLIEDLQIINNDLNSKQNSLKEKHEEERRCWETKSEQLEAEINGEKAMHALKTEQFENSELQLIKLQKTLDETQKIYTQKIDTFETELQTLRTENAELKIKINAKTEELSKMMSELSVQKEKCDQAMKQLEIIELEFEKIGNEKSDTLALKDREVEALTKDRKKLEEQLNTVEIQRNELDKKSESFEEKLQFVESRLQEAQQTYTNAQVDFEKNKLKLEENLKVLGAQNEQYVAEIQKLKGEISDNEVRLLRADEKSKELTTELENAMMKNESINQLQAQLTSMEITLQQVESNRSEVNKMYSDRVNEVKTLKQQLQTLQNEYDNTNAKLELVSEEKSQAEKSNNDLSELIKGKDHLYDRLNETESCLRSVNVECTKLQSEIVSKEVELGLLNDELKQSQECSKAELEYTFGIVRNIEDAIKEMANFLEKQLRICNKENVHFSVIEKLANKCDRPSVTHLIEVVKKVLLTFEQQKTSLKEIPALKTRLKELSDQHSSTLENCNTLKVEFQSAVEEKKHLLEKMTTEFDNLKKDLQNLEQVNESLSNENETLKLTLSNTNADLQILQNNYATLKARLIKAQDCESENTKKMDELNGEQQLLRETIEGKELALEKLQQKLNELERSKAEEEFLLQQNLQATQAELRQAIIEKANQLEDLLGVKDSNADLLSKLQDFESKNAELITQTANLQKECIRLRVESEELNGKYARVNEELLSMTNQLDEAKTTINIYSEKLSKLSVKHQDLQRSSKDIEFQLSTKCFEYDTLMKEKELLMDEKQSLSERLHLSQQDCKDLKNVTLDLNQKLIVFDLEKGDLRRQIELLEKQVEINNRYQTTSESKLKNIVDTSQALERNLLSTQNELKKTEKMLEHSKQNLEKLEVENKKFNENFETLNKRIEKMAIKLGDAQSRCTKLERENEKLMKSNKTLISSNESLQRHKEVQQLECKTLRDRLSKAEARIQAAEKSNAILIATKHKLEAAEIDLRSKITKLENLREVSEERLRKMTQNYEQYERENVKLNHQIGALNTEIESLKNACNVSSNAKLVEMSKNLSKMREHAEELQERNKQLLVECSDLRQQNQCLTDQLSRNSEVEVLETEVKRLHQEKIGIEQVKNNVVNQLESKNVLYQKMLSEKSELEQKILSNETDAIAKNAEISSMLQDVTELRQKVSNLVTEVESLQTRLHAGEVMLEKEQENNAKLRSDNEILQAKYREAKHRAETEVANREERIKENRLELESKLEKMKDKMKFLYTEEITKMKQKHERETVALRSELSIIKAQNTKYQEHTSKLSTELMTLNDRMLECQKENTYLMAKLKYIQNEDVQFKRPTGTNAHATSSTLPRLSSVPSFPSNIGRSLPMEDEEGEIFNNTYLTDLKNGKMSYIGPEELQHRNSLLPPHLKSSYAVQYDHGLCEDEVKDAHSNLFDDSTSGLLGNNSNCMRKKIIGVTHYRKPGPPTPSKNGGRLSFGGSSEPTREILKESYDDNQPSSSGKTPSRFTIFSSRFSMGNSNTTKDENEDEHEMQKQQQNNRIKELNTVSYDLRRALQRRNLEKGNRANDMEEFISKTTICTSTPRKSHGRYSIDKRRLINKLLEQSTPSGNISISPQDITPLEISAIETPTINTCGNRIRGRRQSATFNRTNIQNSKQTHSRFLKKQKIVSTGSSTGAAIVALERRIRRRPRREQGSRPSLCIHKNLFSNKSCTPQRGALRDLKRIMGRKQRMLRFDMQRIVKDSSSSAVDDSDFDVEEISENKENREMATTSVIDGATYAINNSKNCNTVVIAKNEVVSFENENSTHFDSEVMETTKTEFLRSNHGTQTFKTSKELNIPNEHTQQVTYNNDANSGVRFEQLVKETASEAPFEISNLRLSAVCTIQSDSGMTSTTTSTSADHQSDRYLNVKSSNSNLDALSNSKKSDAVFSTVSATSHQSISTTSSVLQHSKTIYGASVIVNRRIPNIDGLRVRKSSIYFKNPKCSTFRSSCGLMSSVIDSNDTNTAGFSQDGDLVLVANQTITLLDLICMWHQMNIWTRMVVSVILLGSVGAIGMLLYIFCFSY